MLSSHKCPEPVLFAPTSVDQCTRHERTKSGSESQILEKVKSEPQQTKNSSVLSWVGRLWPIFWGYFNMTILCAFLTIPQATRRFRRTAWLTQRLCFWLHDLVALQWFIDLTAKVDALQPVDSVRACVWLLLFHYHTMPRYSMYACSHTWQTWGSYISAWENVM